MARGLALLLLSLAAAPLFADSFAGRVVDITDGDTLNVREAGETHRVRLSGIDAPERDQPYGRRSTQNLAELVAGERVQVEYDKRDRYGRIVGKILLDGEDANLTQVRAGLAWHYKRYQHEQSPKDRELYSRAEIKAKEADRGLWRAAEPIAPWNWRRGER